jgi:hypothetical protein
MSRTPEMPSRRISRRLSGQITSITPGRTTNAVGRNRSQIQE